MVLEEPYQDTQDCEATKTGLLPKLLPAPEAALPVIHAL